MHAGQKGIATNGFVQELWIGGVPVREAWCEGVKLYPDERTVVRDIVLGAADDHYWLHAMDAAGKGKSEMVMTLGGVQYHLYRGDGSLPVMRDVGGAFRVPDGCRVLLSDCLDATVSVRAVVPERRVPLSVPSLKPGDEYEVRVLPVIEGTRTSWVQWGSKRHAHGYYWQRVTSPTTGTVFFEQQLYKSGRSAKTYSWAIPASPAADREALLKMWFYVTKHSGGVSSQSVIWPAFEREWQVPVLGVTLQHKVN